MSSPPAPDSLDKPTAAELDSLHVLPLSIIPLETPGLKRARLIKNSRVETVVELFRSRASGSGQVAVRDLSRHFPNSTDQGFRNDIRVIDRLSRSASFDVYSVRIALRQIEISVEEAEYLQLSTEKKAELTERMKAFTQPLIQNIYGDSAGPVEDAGDLTALLRNPDKDEARRRLTQMAERLDVGLAEIPKFVEDYGDIFLSLAYFQDVLDRLVPNLSEFQEWADALRDTWLVRNDRAQDRIIKSVVRDLAHVSGAVTRRFQHFDRKTKDFWEDVSGAKFRQVRALISSHHSTVAGMLCGLTLKMDLWKERFPNSESGGPQSRLDFVISEVLPGLDRVKALTRQEPGS